MKINTLTRIALLTAALASPGLAEEHCGSRALIWLDDTSSVAAASVNQSAFQAIQTIAESAGPERICRIELYQFADQAIYATPFYTVQLPMLKAQECTATKVRGELGWLKAVNKTSTASATESCETKRQERDEERAKLVQNELAKAQAAIINRTKTRGQCTALTDVARRLARTPSPDVKLVVVVSDGIQSCTTSSEAIPSPRVPMKAFMVVMPNNFRRNTGVDFDQIAANWHHLAPWIALILPNELKDSL